jgi:hypothetical protein
MVVQKWFGPDRMEELPEARTADRYRLSASTCRTQLAVTLLVRAEERRGTA